jgi:putative transcriptional regulator
MPRRSRFGKKLIASMREMVDALESGDRRRLTIRRVQLPPEPNVHTAASVRAIRARLKVSQTVFARLLGVSLVLVQSWEQGARKPSKLACRLLDDISANPDRWRKKLRAA